MSYLFQALADESKNYNVVDYDRSKLITMPIISPLF